MQAITIQPRLDGARFLRGITRGLQEHTRRLELLLIEQDCCEYCGAPPNTPRAYGPEEEPCGYCGATLHAYRPKRQFQGPEDPDVGF